LLFKDAFLQYPDHKFSHLMWCEQRSAWCCYIPQWNACCILFS
jgi:hypothetical protein